VPVFVSFFTTAADILQGTIAFVLKIFSFSDKKRVLDVFDSYCWDAACCSTMVLNLWAMGAF